VPLPWFILPFALGALATGATLLQWQAMLPDVLALAGWAAGAGAASIACLAFSTQARAIRLVRCTRVAGTVGAICTAAVLGFTYAAWRAEIRLADALPAAWEGEDVALVGVIDELPQRTDRGTRFTFAVERIETPGARIPDRISLAWYSAWQKGGPIDPVPEIAAGERWRLLVRLRRPHGNVNPAGFDLEAWLLENGLRATGYVRRNEHNARIDAFAGRANDYVQRARSAVRERILAALPDAPYAGVIVALTIGEQRAIPDIQWRVFNRTGIGHLISISGLHVTVFAAIAGAVALALARRNVALTSRIPARKVAAGAGLAFALGYVLLAGAGIPAVRTLLMLAVAATGLWLGRPGTASLVWLWALVVVLLWDPWAGLTPGFWLSFGAVGALLYAGVGRLTSPPAGRVAPRMAHALREATRTQLVVTLALGPGTLALFGQVSLVSPLANALAIPVVTFVVVPLALAGIVLPLEVLWQGAHAVFAVLMAFLEWCATAPGAVWEQHAPRRWAVAAALVGVAWLIAPRGVPARALGAVWLAPLFFVRPEPLPSEAFRMTVLDVGQGLAAVIETRSHALLYDTGPRYTDTADAGARVVAPFLRSAGIARLGAMVVTHQDSDHSGGVLSVLQVVPVDWLASSLPADHAILLQRSTEEGTIVRCTAGQRWEWDGVRFEVLQPAPSHYLDAKAKPNDLSCVVRVASRHGSVLLTGDLEARGELELVRNDPAGLASDVLLVPHHGSRTSSTAPFIAAVAPRVAVFTAGYRNRFGHPRPDVVQRYRAAGVRIHRTDFDGALEFTFAPGAAREPVAARDIQRRYWHGMPVRDSVPPLE
jgi:competence protein ComEC